MSEPVPAGPPVSYSLSGIQEMLGMSRGVILGYVHAGFVAPTRGPRNSYRFAFQDVVLLRTAQELRDAAIPSRRIRGALRRLRTRLPDTLPLTGLRISAVGDDVAVREGGQAVAAESGQLLFDFEVRGASGDVLRFPAKATTDAEPDWLARGTAFEGTDVAAAIAAYRHAIEADPLRGAAYLNLGALLYEQGRLPDALALYDLAIARLPDDADMHFNRAIVLEDLDDAEAALAAYERCLALDPDYADAHWNAARLHERANHPRQAIQHFSAFRRLQR